MRTFLQTHLRGGCPLRPRPGAPGTQGGRTARRGARGGRWSRVPYPRGPSLQQTGEECKCTEGRGGPSNWGAMPIQREALERPLSPIPFHSFPQPPTHPFYRWFARGRERERSCSPPHLQTVPSFLQNLVFLRGFNISSIRKFVHTLGLY